MATTSVLAIVQSITVTPYHVGCSSLERRRPEKGLVPVEKHRHPQAD
ncbi:MAG: hypothetical protein ABWY10_12650 [Tardiphaga sp.]